MRAVRRAVRMGRLMPEVGLSRRRLTLCRPHPCSPHHANVVQSYRVARHAAVVLAERLDTQDERLRVPTFREWLQASRVER